MNSIFCYTPGAGAIELDGTSYDIQRGEFLPYRSFRIDPIIYAGETELKWQVDFMVSYPTTHGSAARGLGGARITEDTIRAVLEVFYSIDNLIHLQSLDLIFGDGDGKRFIALGYPERGLAVAFRDHQ